MCVALPPTHVGGCTLYVGRSTMDNGLLKIVDFEGKFVTFKRISLIVNKISIGDNSFKGAIQNVEFYDTQLTDAQVKDIYKYGTYNNLVAHYKFDEGSGITAKDSSKNNYHGKGSRQPSCFQFIS